MSAMARELTEAGDPISRQAIARRIAKYELGDLAAQLAVKHAVPGRRAPGADLAATRDAERARILDALARHGSYRAAAPKLAMSLRTMIRRIERYSITAIEILARRAELARPPRRRSA